MEEEEKRVGRRAKEKEPVKEEERGAVGSG